MKPVNFLSIALNSMWVCRVWCVLDYLDLICFDNYRFHPKKMSWCITFLDMVANMYMNINSIEKVRYIMKWAYLYKVLN